MEPVETNSYMREAALSLAVQHAQHRPELHADRVIIVAEQFLYWLRKDSV